MRQDGEFQRIDLFLKAFREAGGLTSSDVVRLGPGDDAAVIAAPSPLAVTTDSLVENVHFRRRWATWRQIGRKAVAVNLSDLGAMGARPVAFTCALVLGGEVGREALADLAGGMADAARKWGFALAGGNLSRGSETSITLTAFGSLAGEPLRRDAARAGDAVLIAGDLGVAAAELRWLEAGRALPPGRSALLEPEAQVEAGLAAAGLARCGIDISDGLAQDLGHVARASDVAVRLDFPIIPVTERFRALTGDATPAERARMLLAGGEDYALAIVGPPETLARVRAAAGGTLIGRVEAGAGVQVDGLPAGVDLSGFDHWS